MNTPISIRGLIVLFAAITLGAGCASLRHRDSMATSNDSSIPATVNAAAEENATHVTEISFAKDSSELTEEARRSLVSIIDAARISRSIEDVKILAWADREYPSTRIKKLSTGERDLAENRTRVIKDFLNAHFDLADIDTVNMAKRPNTVQRWLRTDNARLKQAMEVAGIRDTDSPNDARAAKASRAVVMLITE